MVTANVIWKSNSFGRLFISCLLKNMFSSLKKKLNQKESSPFGNQRGYLRTETLGSGFSERPKGSMSLPGEAAEGYMCFSAHFARTLSDWVGRCIFRAEKTSCSRCICNKDYELSQPIWPPCLQRYLNVLVAEKASLGEVGDGLSVQPTPKSGFGVFWKFKVLFDLKKSAQNVTGIASHTGWLSLALI